MCSKVYIEKFFSSASRLTGTVLFNIFESKMKFSGWKKHYLATGIHLAEMDSDPDPPK
jgi:hypothetical protein